MRNAPRTTPIDSPRRQRQNEGLVRLEALFDRLSREGRFTDAADVSYAISVLKRERGDYDHLR